MEHEWGLKYLNRLSDLLFVLAYCAKMTKKYENPLKKAK